MTILSRHQGPAVPSASAPTGAGTLTDHLERQLLPRVTPFLERVLASRRERDRERELRAEQERAFADAAARDRARMTAKADAERAARDARRREEEDAAAAARVREAEKEARVKWEARRMAWRRWAGRALIPYELESTARGGITRVAVRMPDGRRITRIFGPGATLTALYVYVDVQFADGADGAHALPEGMAPGEDGLAALVSETEGGADGWWGFRLVTAYPRRELKWEPKRILEEIEGVKGGAQLVVEMLDRLGTSGRSAVAGQTGDDDDGYDTEESE